MARDEYDHLRESADAARLAELMAAYRAEQAGRPSRFGSADDYYRAPDLDRALARAGAERARQEGLTLEPSGGGFFAYRAGHEELAVHAPTREEAVSWFLQRERERREEESE